MRGEPSVPRSEVGPWTVPFHGTVAGIIGAAVVAVVYLCIDVAAGRPFYTPNALGAALFRGEALGLDAPIELVLVFGYTLVHGGVFLGFGLLASFVELEARLRHSDGTRELWITGLIAVGLFAAFQLTFAIFTWLLLPGQGQLGGLHAAFANAFAALAMAGYLALVRLRYADRLTSGDVAMPEAAARARSSSGRS